MFRIMEKFLSSLLISEKSTTIEDSFPIAHGWFSVLKNSGLSVKLSMIYVCMEKFKDLILTGRTL